MLDWNDIAAYVAVARAGSTLSVAAELKISQTTVARRIGALEAALGVALFHRLPSGYRLTDAGAALFEQAETVERATRDFAARAESLVRSDSAVVKLSLEEIYAVTIMLPLLPVMAARHPGIRLVLDTSDALRDLANGDADIALRSCVRPEGPGLIARRLADDKWSFYCSKDYAAVHGVPHTIKALGQSPIIGGGGKGFDQHYRGWLERHGISHAVTIEQGSLTGLLAAVRSGLGVALLPTLIADREPGLVRCMPPGGGERGLWLVSHERVRHQPEIKLVRDFLARHLLR